MAGIPTQSLDSVVTRVRAFFRTSFKLPMGVKQFLGNQARAVGLSVWGLQQEVEDLDADIVPNANSSSDALSSWAFTLGLPDGAGGYGRAVPNTASGGAALLTGVQGAAYADGTVATAEDGVTQVQLSGAVAIAGSPPALGSVAAKFIAAAPGSAGNLPVGTVCTWSSAPAGADPTFTLTSGLTNGTDSEENADLYARIVAQGQAPPTGGNTTDIHDWVAEVAGVAGCYVYPRRNGTGSVDVVITVGGTGTGRSPSADILSAADDVIEVERVPGSESFRVLAPAMPAANGHSVVVRVVPNGATNVFDWSDAFVSYFVNVYTPGATNVLQMTADAPISLKSAVDAYNAGTGLAPRLQIMSTGSVINPPITVTAYTEVGGGLTNLTLGPVPVGWVAPTVGDAVFAYGPVVATIAAGVLALCDALGPSRQSGYADTQQPWQDTLSINQIVRVAEDAIDTSGTALVVKVIDGGVTIDGGTTDVTGADMTVAPPELLYLSHVAVIAGAG